MNLWDMVMLKLKEAFNTHKADTSAHHARYTDAEVDTIVAAHTAIVDAHHARYTDVEVDTIVAAHAAIEDAHHSKYTDAEVDTIVAAHAAIASVHHTKYLDSDAVTAIASADEYLKNTGDQCDGLLNVRRDVSTNTPIAGLYCNTSVNDAFVQVENKTSSAGKFLPALSSLSNAGNGFSCLFVARVATANDVYNPAYASFMIQGQRDDDTQLQNANIFAVSNYAEGLFLIKKDGTMDVKNHKIKDIKNHVDATLSGTPKIIEIDISGTSYYFKVYPTKT